MDKIKILIVDNGLPLLLNHQNAPVGGASIQALNWLAGFKNYSEVKVISSKIVDNKSDTEVYQYKHNPLYTVFGKYSEIFEVLDRWIPDIIFVTVAGLNTFIWGNISKKLGCYYIQRISNDIVYDNKKYKEVIGSVKYYLSLAGIKKSNLILCQNEYQLRNIQKVKSNNTVSIIKHNPFNYTNNLNSLNSIGIHKKHYIAWVGIFQIQKNMEALQKIAQGLPDEKFKIAGKMKSNIDPKTRECIKELKKLKNVEFIGFLDRKEIYGFLRSSFCLLNTSFYEGFSNTYLEAFAVNTPVVTTSKTDPDNIIKNNGLGLVAQKYSDIPFLIKKIKTMNFNDNIFTDYLKENHSPARLAKSVLHYYHISNKHLTHRTY